MDKQGSIITDDMRSEIGSELPPVVFEVDKSACRMFARAVGYTDPIYFDEQQARSRGFRSIPAPFGFLGHPVYDPSRPPRAGGYFLQSSPYTRILSGGSDIECSSSVCAGDILTATTRLADLGEHSGRLGPMLITHTETAYRNQQGELVAIARRTAIRY